MLTVLCAKATGDSLSLGIYDTHITLKGAPYLEEHDPLGHTYPEADRLSVADVCSNDLVTLPPTPALRNVVAVLRSCRHNGFAVVDGEDAAQAPAPLPFAASTTPRPGTPVRSSRAYGLPIASGLTQHRMRGSVLRSHLLHMIEHRIGVYDPDLSPGGFPCEASTEAVVAMLAQLDAPVANLRDVSAAVDAARLLPGELERLRIDLRPFLQPNPMLIAADAPLSRAYNVFRTLGLRHLYVTESQPVVVGVLTRKDVWETNGQRKWISMQCGDAQL